MEQQLEDYRLEALHGIAAAADETALETVRIAFLGRAGKVSAVSEGMKSLSREEKPRVGKKLNEVRTAITAAYEARRSELENERDAAALRGIDLTLPGTARFEGSLHPITQLLDRAISIFRQMGFALADGPDIETEWHCFDALNTPPDHPARNEGDTFYLPDGRLLRSQTSTVQVRTMETTPPPVRIIAPGGVYRRDEVDATHLAQFTQIEGLYVDEGVTLGDLKGTINFFFRELLGSDVQVRMRPHFFPFTEPSFEIDIKAAALGRGDRWLELAGCGMVDPAVFGQINGKRGDTAYDPEKYTGFAFGFGLDRLAMILSGVHDIRLFTENDIRFLAQYP
ncbi:MAG TPA: phenylalanine--tRNA ligase subunit alpha [Chthoniobacteraceae bacterium]|nr:phenylalanine--tRNA ligase subunit alpha [Chthoniobacteraceae bacterium]